MNAPLRECRGELQLYRKPKRVEEPASGRGDQSADRVGSFCWSEEEQRQANDYKHQRAEEEMSALGGVEEGLYRHGGGVGEAGPSGEGNQAAMGRRITRGKQHAERTYRLSIICKVG